MQWRAPLLSCSFITACVHHYFNLNSLFPTGSSSVCSRPEVRQSFDPRVARCLYFQRWHVPFLRLQEWEDVRRSGATQVEEYTDFWQTSKIITLSIKVWVLVMFAIVTTWPSTEQVTRNLTQNLFVFQPHEARRPWSLAPTLRRMKLVSALGFQGRFSDSIDFEVLGG